MSVSLRSTSSLEQVPSQPELHSEIWAAGDVPQGQVLVPGRMTADLVCWRMLAWVQGHNCRVCSGLRSALLWWHELGGLFIGPLG